MDKLRKYLDSPAFKETGWTWARLSRELGKSHAYIQQFVKRGIPIELDPRDVARIIDATGVDESVVGVSASPPAPVRLRAGIKEVSEYDALASAGGGISLDERKVGPWPFPADYLNGELRLQGADLALIRVKGDSMEPTLRSGDRILVDMTDKNVSQPGLFVLWDGDGRVVKRVERIPAADPASLLLKSDNPLHGQYQVPAELVTIIGRVVWAARRL